ncbi:serine hydrolase domain-containing protein [Actinomadura yumaensis]|uniref:Serine hydrolase domain-containing protein n=1 Tax=Actinomadura yumaensis TaxID=111807 RepID=A0ABW2CS82_9ACTN|nr:serine hydrolase [Actinomadura sp. J1-007]
MQVSREKATRTAVTLGAAVLLSATAVATATADSRSHGKTREALNEIVRGGTPGVIAQVTSGRHVWNAHEGVAVIGGRERRANERFRVASLTKPFTATVLLQMEAEKELSLDDSVEKWLPGVVRGNGYDGRRITVRQLLNHTSGIFNYNDDKSFLAKFSGDAFLKHRFDGATPEELVRTALANPPVFRPPGAPGRWAYSDTNYILAGMIIERVSGGSYAHEVERRIVRPLNLRSTSVPGRTAALPGRHARHYSTLGGGKVHDVTEFDPSVAGSAGQIISTAGDLNRFFRALMRGWLLPPSQRGKMLDTVPVEGADGHGGGNDRYGLGLRKFKLSCGWVWGHGGMLPGSLSRVAASRDGRHVLTLNRNADWGDQALEDRTVEAEFCS